MRQQRCSEFRSFKLPVAALCLGLCALLVACSSAPPKPQMTKMQISVSADVNPDSQNHPSPIVVRVYQLKDDAAFKDADFFALYDKEQATLGPALVSRAEFELTPGEQRLLDYPLALEARFLGVAAGYRDIRNAQWRALDGAPDKKLINMVKKNKIDVVVERAKVSFADK
jgi:type VI secretion system protein VasD